GNGRKYMGLVQNKSSINLLMTLGLLMFTGLALPACEYDGALSQLTCETEADCAGGAVCQAGYCVVEDSAFYGKVEIVDATPADCEHGGKTITIGSNEPFSVCHGLAGRDGVDGKDGLPGADGAPGM